MEEIRDCNGKLVAIVDPENGVAEYSQSGKIRISVQTPLGCKIEIDTKDSVTILERINNRAFNVLQYAISR